MSTESPVEHTDLLAPAESDDDECCGGENRRNGECEGEGKGRGQGRCCGDATEAPQPEASA